jgi:hypothetical protein
VLVQLVLQEGQVAVPRHVRFILLRELALQLQQAEAGQGGSEGWARSQQ